jgi:hypothetical protein
LCIAKETKIDIPILLGSYVILIFVIGRIVTELVMLGAAILARGLTSTSDSRIRFEPAHPSPAQQLWAFCILILQFASEAPTYSA